MCGSVGSRSAPFRKKAIAAFAAPSLNHSVEGSRSYSSGKTDPRILVSTIGSQLLGAVRYKGYGSIQSSALSYQAFWANSAAHSAIRCTFTAGYQPDGFTSSARIFRVVDVPASAAINPP